MSSIAFGVPVQFSKAFIQGISELTATDITYAEGLGYRIKLLGITKRTTKGIELRVHPCLVPSKRLIANVEGAMNAVMVCGDAVGTTLHYGKGAGSEPTGSAVIADLIDIARVSEASPAQRVPFLAFQTQHLSDFPVLNMDEVITSYYLRIRVADQTGVLANIASIFAKHNISIDALRQREADEVCGEGANQTDLVVLTHDCNEGQMKMALEQIQALPTVLDKVILIRKEELA
jgi:homoserine dehydrogenase